MCGVSDVVESGIANGCNNTHECTYVFASLVMRQHLRLRVCFGHGVIDHIDRQVRASSPDLHLRWKQDSLMVLSDEISGFSTYRRTGSSVSVRDLCGRKKDDAGLIFSWLYQRTQKMT